MAAAAGLSPLVADEVDDAFASLVEGRAYLRQYPEVKTQGDLVDEFLGIGVNSASRPALVEAMNRAIEIRRNQPPEPMAPLDPAIPSIQAKVIGWEALESLMTGYLYAGNRDLLNAIRVAYPGGGGVSEMRELPVEEADYFGSTSQITVNYARLYFLQGIKDTLGFIAQDSTGDLRAGSSSYALPHYVSFDDETSAILPFPRFNDDNFVGDSGNFDGEAMQSVAYLFGSAMERYGLASVAYADQLWKSAFAGPDAGVKRPESQKKQMLERATEVLQSSIHAQFLATLPIAAQLDDGTTGNDDFQLAKINQARVSVTDAQRLRERILAGEKPTQTLSITAWDPASIQLQIQRCNDTYQAAAVQWSGTPPGGSVEKFIGEDRVLQTQNAERAISLRTSIESQLLNITGVDPSLLKYNNLLTEDGRQLYLSDVESRYDDFLNTRFDDPNASLILAGGEMAVQAIRLVQAVREVDAKVAQIRSFGERIFEEEKRNDEVNGTIQHYGREYAALDSAMLLAGGIQKSAGVSSLGTYLGIEINLGAGLQAATAALKAFRAADERTSINDTQSEAAVKNLYIEQAVVREQLPVVAASVQLAGTQLRTLFNRAKRLVEDHAFYVEETGDLWYRDPSLAFKLEAAEEKYRSLVQEYRIELYNLARLLEAAWTERFQNPIKRADGSIDALNNGSFDEFTEAESVFSVPHHERGLAFFNALKAWDQRLRGALFRGPYDGSGQNLIDVNFISGRPISLRQDIFKLIDSKYNFELNRYETDDKMKRQNIQKFRAILLNLASRDPVNGGDIHPPQRLRIDFPLIYNQVRVIPDLGLPVPMVAKEFNAQGVDRYWNHRVRQIGIKIVGANVFPAGVDVPAPIELYGTVDRIGFFTDSLFTASRAISTFNLPLYLRDPDQRPVGEPIFGTPPAFRASIGSNPVTMYDVVGWPLFCDNIVLQISQARANNMRIENIEDVEIHLKMEVGSPPPINW